MSKKEKLWNEDRTRKCVINKEGFRQNFMTVTSKFKKINGRYHWYCRCDCGGGKWIESGDIRDNTTKPLNDCGCGLHREKKRKYGKMSHHPLYNVRKDMIDRCTNKNHHKYENYGGRGIFVCDRWLESLNNFIEDMGERPTPKHQIDRIDNDDGYYKENCRWVTQLQNSYNVSGKKNGKSRYRGVSWRKTKTTPDGKQWYGRISKRIFDKEGNLIKTVRRSKTFDTEIECALWYNEQAKELFGEYANLNKIQKEKSED